MKKSAATAKPDRNVTRSGPRRISGPDPGSRDPEPFHEGGIPEGRQGECHHDRRRRERLGPVLAGDGPGWVRPFARMGPAGQGLLPQKGATSGESEKRKLGSFAGPPVLMP